MARARARCLLCGIHEGNSAFVPVLTFSLVRSTRGQTRSYGTIGLCDRCRRENDIVPDPLPEPSESPRGLEGNFTLARG